MNAVSVARSASTRLGTKPTAASLSYSVLSRLPTHAAVSGSQPMPAMAAALSDSTLVLISFTALSGSLPSRILRRLPSPATN